MRLSSPVPEICRFFGIIIFIYYNEHNPPHFHAVFGEVRASFTISNLALMRGSLPPRAFAMVLEWAFMHRYDLQRAWDQAAENQKPDKIEPLR